MISLGGDGGNDAICMWVIVLMIKSDFIVIIGWILGEFKIIFFEFSIIFININYILFAHLANYFLSPSLIFLIP